MLPCHFFWLCDEKKKTLSLKGKHDQPAGWFETIKFVLLLPQVAFLDANLARRLSYETIFLPFYLVSWFF